jgi:hypothetical protein
MAANPKSMMRAQTEKKQQLGQIVNFCEVPRVGTYTDRCDLTNFSLEIAF